MELAGLGIDQARLLDMVRRLQRFNARLVAADTTATAADDLIMMDTTAASRTVTLPLAAQHPNMRVEVKKMVAANTLTVQRSGSDTIDGVSSKAWTTKDQVYGFGSVIVAAPATWGWVVLHG